MFFGKSILCECDKPILKKTTSPTTGKLEFVSVVQNRTDSTSDSELLLESFSDEEADKKDSKEANGNKFDDSLDLKTHHDAAEIRRLLRRKDELERKQKMEQKYNERLQVSAVFYKFYFTTIALRAYRGMLLIGISPIDNRNFKTYDSILR